MRLGPAVYDLASLVYDPYVKLSERERAAIVKVYADATARGGEISAVLPFAAVERLVQCLGAYGRLASVGQGQFKKYILPALENLLAAADEAGLDAIGALAEELIHLETESGKKSTHQHHCNCR
jgi:aminoglycoside/choline kinase family phosphotransferase